VVVLNSTAVELSWEYPDSPNGEIRGYSILYAEFPDIEELSINITLDTINDASGQTIVMDKLKPFTQYSFRVRSFSFGDQNERPNFTHIGIATDEVIVRTAEDGKIFLAKHNNVWLPSITLHIVPEAPTNFTAVAISSTTIQLSWNVPNVTNGIVLNYTVVYFNDTDIFITLYDNDTFNDTIRDLNEDTFYEFVIFANTNAGDGVNVTDVAVTFEDCKWNNIIVDRHIKQNIIICVTYVYLDYVCTHLYYYNRYTHVKKFNFYN